jgi:hypothetical protein
MKKIITLSLSLLVSSIGFSQNAPINFETGGQGASWTWTTFENGTNPTLEIVNNPSSVAPNTSSKVAKFTALKGGNPWAGCESAKGSDIGTFSLSASNAKVKILVYKTRISDVGIKFVNSTNGSTGEIKVANTKINEWEELTFDFSSKIGVPESNNITQIVIFPDFIPGGDPRADTTISYFDNITFSGGTTIAEPTAPAMAPTKLAADVISLFSNAYTNVTVDTWRTGWSNGTLTEMKIGTDDVKKYSGLDFVGIEMIAKPINISAMDLFEFDIWTPNSTNFRFKLVDAGANGTIGGGDDKEHELTVTPTLEGWNHIAVPISNFTGLTTKSNIAQLIFASAPVGTSIVYLDNIMFSKAPVLAEPTVAAKTPTKLAKDVISLFSNAYTNVTVDTWRTSWSNGTLTETKIGADDVKKYTGLDFVGIETIAKQIDLTGMDSFEFDMWTPNSTAFRFKLVDAGADGVIGGGNDKEHETTITPTLNGWNHVAVAISSMTGLTTKKNIAQLIFASAPVGTSIVYIDNVLFSKKTSVGVSSIAQETIGVFPNPASNNLNITTKNNIQDIAIYNALGQVVLTTSPNANTVNVDITSLPNGFYTVKASIDGVDTFKKIIKE